MTERAATRAADCRHNRSCLRCNSRENHGSDGVPFLHEVLLSTTIRLNLRGAAGLSLFYGKSEILPPYNAQICQRIFDGLPFRSVFGRDGLNTIEDRGFCRRYSLQELFTVKLQKRNLVFILPFGIKNLVPLGRPLYCCEYFMLHCSSVLRCLTSTEPQMQLYVTQFQGAS